MTSFKTLAAGILAIDCASAVSLTRETGEPFNIDHIFASFYDDVDRYSAPAASKSSYSLDAWAPYENTHVAPDWRSDYTSEWDFDDDEDLFEPYVSGYYGDYDRSYGAPSAARTTYKGDGYQDFAGDFIHGGSHNGNASYTSDASQNFDSYSSAVHSAPTYSAPTPIAHAEPAAADPWYSINPHYGPEYDVYNYVDTPARFSAKYKNNNSGIIRPFHDDHEHVLPTILDYKVTDAPVVQPADYKFPDPNEEVVPEPGQRFKIEHHDLGIPVLHDDYIVEEDVLDFSKLWWGFEAFQDRNVDHHTYEEDDTYPELHNGHHSKTNHMKFDHYFGPEGCPGCEHDKDGHFHHALDHPDAQHAQGHSATDPIFHPTPQEEPASSVPESLANAAIARGKPTDYQKFGAAANYPEAVHEIKHTHHVLDHPDFPFTPHDSTTTTKHDHTGSVAADHTHPVAETAPEAIPEHVSVANYYRAGGIDIDPFYNEPQFNYFTPLRQKKRKVTPPSEPTTDALALAALVRSVR